jgi:hypothetical protein
MKPRTLELQPERQSVLALHRPGTDRDGWGRPPAGGSGGRRTNSSSKISSRVQVAALQPEVAVLEVARRRAAAPDLQVRDSRHWQALAAGTRDLEPPVAPGRLPGAGSRDHQVSSDPTS